MDWITEDSESDCRTSYPISRRIFDGRTAACESVVIADSPVFGRMLFLEGELQSAAADEHIYHETLVHPVMAGARTGCRVLVVGGGEGATVREVLKWTPSKVDWVDIDGELVSLCTEHLSWAPGVLANPLVQFYAEDIRQVLPRLGSYDVIILDLPDPDGDTGYLYSDEFWQDIRWHLAAGGRMATHCGPVRPFGNIGEGFQRVRHQFHEGGLYTQMIPSFQSEWGFLIWSAIPPFASIRRDTILPEHLRVVDIAQLEQWSSPSLVWSTALNAADMYTHH